MYQLWIFVLMSIWINDFKFDFENWMETKSTCISNWIKIKLWNRMLETFGKLKIMDD